MFVFFFFFSSRRRHTRYWRDWSSDVCSSDLARDVEVGIDVAHHLAHVRHARRRLAPELPLVRQIDFIGVRHRSEERRVGKECRCRGAPRHEKKKERKTTRNKKT